jgi:hypothetical protein
VEDTTSRDTTHDLLLALAGRVDDDLLRWARELVALGEDARAVEMITASLVAARVVLPPPVHSALVAAAHSARTDLAPAAALPPPQPSTGTEHRFTAPAGDDPVAGALLDFPARPLTGCTVLLARRLTPAGSAPGPLPHPVVLVRVHDHTRHAEVLAYQLGAALDWAGAPASVEVLPADGPVPRYHAAALDAAVELRHEVGDDRPWRPSPQAAGRPAPAPQPPPAPERHAFAPAPHPLAADPPRPAPRPPAPAPEPLPDDPAAATVRLQPAGAPREDPEPEPERLLEEHDDFDEDTAEDEAREDEARGDEGSEYDGSDDADSDDEDTDERPYDLEDEDDRHEEDDEPEDVEDDFADLPSPHPLAPPRPLPVRDEARPAPPTPLTPRAARPQPSVTPISRNVPNPIPLVRRSGPNPIARPVPLNESRPNLRRVETDADAPERPTDDGTPEERPARRETSALDSLSDPLNGPLHQPLLAPLLDPTEDPLGLGSRRARPAPPQPAPSPPAAALPDDEWSEEWLSGTWAMAPSVLEERAEPKAEPEPEPGPVEESGFDRPAPRPVPRTPARHRFPDEPAAEHEAAENEPEEQDEESRSELGPRTESVARLSDADRQLLARLQAELLEGHRQRIGRRITNGSHRGSPPDLGA